MAQVRRDDEGHTTRGMTALDRGTSRRMGIAPATWRARPYLGSIGAACLAALLASLGCKGAATETDAAAPKRPRVTVDLLKLEDWALRVRTPATVTPPATVNVVAKVPGRVRELPVPEGAEVQAGDLLVALDTRDLGMATRVAEGQLRIAQAGLEAARVQRDTLQRDFQRFQELAKTSAVSRADYDKVESGYRAATAQASLAEAQARVAQVGLEVARKNLADAQVKAPISGIVVRRGVDVGQETSPLSSVPLVILSATDPMHVEGAVPEPVLGSLHPGMKATVRLDGLPGETFEGTVDLVGPTVDPVSKSVRLRVNVPNPRGADGRRRIVAGMSATIEVVPEEGRYFVLPLNAVRRQDGDLLVLLFLGPDSTVAERKVRPVRKDGLHFLAREGLTEGERLVVAAPKDLEPGTAVDVAGGGR